jgi:hypothetical protein
MVEKSDLERGDDVVINFVRKSPLHDGRDSMETTVEEVSGQIVYLANPFGETYPKLVVDPENDLWARGEDGKDGFYGRNVEIERAAKVEA